ncbi:MAG: nitrous oxide reductase family maturation protein NosD [Promethearchaeota archaeon]
MRQLCFIGVIILLLNIISWNLGLKLQTQPNDDFTENLKDKSKTKFIIDQFSVIGAKEHKGSSIIESNHLKLSYNSSYIRTTSSHLSFDPLLHYNPHDPIKVTSDSELAEVAVNGSGTITDPYILEGWNITTNHISGIDIEDTTKYFVIRNCWLSTYNTTGIIIDSVGSGTTIICNNFFQNNGYCISISKSDSIIITNNAYKNNFGGIYLFTSDFVIITNNSWQNNDNGVDLFDSDSVTVINNTWHHNDLGISLVNSDFAKLVNNIYQNNEYGSIWLLGSKNSIIINNTCQNNGGGIYLMESDFTTIINNTCNQNNGEGIYLHQSRHSIIANNFCQKNAVGLQLYDSEPSTIVNNSFIENGLSIIPFSVSLESYLSLTVEDNWVNGLPLGFLTNLQNTTLPTSYGQLILVNCTNVTITDQNCTNTCIGITLYLSFQCQILNNTCNQNNLGGIILWDSPSTTVANNSCQNNDYRGIWLLDSDNSIVANNTCTQTNGLGIAILYCNSATVVNNTCIQNDCYGITFVSSISSTVVNNTCTRNNRAGIHSYMTDSSIISDNVCTGNNGDGIQVEYNSNSILIHNTCYENLRYGISILASDNCLILWNFLQKNQNYGAYLTLRSNNNVLHHNSFFFNNENSTQAYDNGTNTQWYALSTNQGNYWSDYSGSNEYQIDGNAKTIDPYPLVEQPVYKGLEITTNLLPQTTTKTSTETKLIITPFFAFFLLFIGILGHYRKKQRLLF